MYLCVLKGFGGFRNHTLPPFRLRRYEGRKVARLLERWHESQQTHTSAMRVSILIGDFFLQTTLAGTRYLPLKNHTWSEREGLRAAIQALAGG